LRAHRDRETGASVRGILGADRPAVQLYQAREVAADAMFIFIGSSPRTEVVAGLVERDPQGFILTGRDLLLDGQWPKTSTANRDPFLLETSIPGVFAAGDARHGSGKRVTSRWQIAYTAPQWNEWKEAAVAADVYRNLGRACNSVQGAAATMASPAILATWNLQLTESKESCGVRISPSPPTPSLSLGRCRLGCA